MATYKTPGVYVEEIPTLGSSVAAVPTAIPGFTGFTEKAIVKGKQWVYTGGPTPPVRITSMLEFQQLFGGANTEPYEITLTGTTLADYSIAVGGSISSYTLYYHMQMFFANGGGTCYVVSVGNYPTVITDTLLSGGISMHEQVDEITMLVTPEITAVAEGATQAALNDKMLTQCKMLQDRFAIIDVVSTGDVSTDADAFRDDGIGTNNLKYGASYYPSLITTLSYAYDTMEVTIADDRTGEGDGPFEGKKLGDILTGFSTTAADISLYNAIVAKLQARVLVLYPSATMAGIYAYVDDSRGVWKAPANVSLLQVNRPTMRISDDDQKKLNVDAASGKSINAIRQFTGKGNIVWGARTLAGNDNEWRYINVRRLFIFVEDSIRKATEFIVFEPNNAATWQRVKSMCDAFLTGLWRDGALAGATTKDAFFVRVGLGETMSADDILNGNLIVEIGMAAVRPAEFIVLKFSHKIQVS